MNEMVHGPCAHVELLTVVEFTGKTASTELQTAWLVTGTKFQINSLSGYKTLLTDQDEL
jgi:hypothetical protein